MDYCIRESFIHNHRTHRNGVAILHKGEDKYIKVPLISIKTYDRRRGWIWGYKVQDMEKAVSYKEFYEQNKELLVHGRTKIIIVLKERMRIKNKNMREYRARTMRSISQNDEHMEI